MYRTNCPIVPKPKKLALNLQRRARFYMKTVASRKHIYVDVKIRKQGEQYVLLADCPCGETHVFNGGTKDSLYITGLRKGTCGKSLFTTLDANDGESNAHVFDVLQFQALRWRHKKAIRSLKRRKKLLESLRQCERDILIEKHNAAIKAIRESPSLIERLKQMDNEYLQHNRIF